MRFVDVYRTPEAIAVLYQLLAERPAENRISHENMPSIDEHKQFIESRPFRYWLLIQMDDDDWPILDEYVGAIEVTDRNEIGISLLEKQHRTGLGRRAIRKFLQDYQPLPAIPAIRNGHWLANIASQNERSKVFFGSLGFRKIQETWVL